MISRLVAVALRCRAASSSASRAASTVSICGTACTTSPGQFEALVGQPVGEVHLGEAVGQRRVGAAGAGQAGRVVVAADDHRRHPVRPDAGQGPLGHPEGPVGRSWMVEDVAQPDHQVRLLGQGQFDGRLERLLEVELPLIDPAVGGEGVVGAAQVGVADGSYSHTAPANQRRSDE